VSRPLLSLYTLDRTALKAFSAELKDALADDDRARVSALLGLGGSLIERMQGGERAVDWFLRADDDPVAAPFFASLRRMAKKRALALAWASAEPSLEGRLRHFDVVRDERSLAELVDKLLDPARLPWFLLRPGATAGWLDDARRRTLAAGLRPLRPALPPELTAFADALAAADGDVMIHDGL
jgi:hypothetical protein